MGFRLRAAVAVVLACCLVLLAVQSRLALMHEEFVNLRDDTLHGALGTIARQVELAASGPLCAATPDEFAAPRPRAAALGRSRIQRILRRQLDPAQQPTLRQLMAEDTANRVPPPAGVDPRSVTVVLEFKDAAALCRQLHALLRQTLLPDLIMVAAFHTDDNGRAARAVAESIEHGGRVHVFSVYTVPSAAGEAGAGNDPHSASGLASFAGGTRFQLALQATTRHVLVLDWWLTPGPRLLATLAHAADVPMSSGVLGVAGWRALGGLGLDETTSTATATAEVAAPGDEPPQAGDSEPDADTAEVADVTVDSSGTSSLSLPDLGRRVYVPRLLQVDLLRGAWFVQADWLPLLLREATLLQASEGVEATISQCFLRHGDLPSRVLPTIDIDGTMLFDLKHAPLVSAAEERAWRHQLWEGARHGDGAPPWRAPGSGVSGSLPQGSLPQGSLPQGSLPQGSIPQGSLPHGSSRNGERRGASPKPVALLMLAAPADAAAMRPLHAALSSARSEYEPRLVLTPPAGTSCAELAAVMGLPAVACRHSLQVYELHGDLPEGSCGVAASGEGGAPVGDEGAAGGHGGDGSRNRSSTREQATCGAGVAVMCAGLLVAMDDLVASTDAELLVVLARGGASAGVAEAAGLAASTHRAVLLQPPPADAEAMGWIGTIPPAALAQWFVPRVEIAIITANRPASLQRLLSSLERAHYFGDAADVTISIEAGAASDTMDLVQSWRWRHGSKQLHPRAVRGGLISAVVESWFPSSDTSYGLLLEDDIEVSPFFYAWIKLALLSYVHTGRPPPKEEEDDDPSTRLIGISLYTPRLLEMRYPRKRIDLYSALPGSAAAAAHAPPLFLQQLPCSWGSLFFPGPWMEFHEYMQRRLHGGAPAVNIPDSAVNGWSVSWKKFMIELCHLRGYVMLYPNFFNQSSFSTNHLEKGEHVGSKISMHRHLPIDFTVPLLHKLPQLRTLWSDAAGALRPLPPLGELRVLDHFTRPTSLAELAATGHGSVSELARAAESAEMAAGGSAAAPSGRGGPDAGYLSFLRSWL